MCREWVPSAHHHADTARSDADAVSGLNSGANDYVGKPFRSSCAWPVFARNSANTKQARMRNPSRPLHPPTNSNLVDPQGVKLPRPRKKRRSCATPIAPNNNPSPARRCSSTSGATTPTCDAHARTHIDRLRQKIENNPAEAQRLDHRRRRLQAGGGAAAGGEPSDARRRSRAARADESLRPPARAKRCN